MSKKKIWKPLKLYAVSSSGRSGTKSLTLYPDDGFITSVLLETKHIFPQQSELTTSTELSPKVVDKLIDFLTKLRKKQRVKYPD